MRLIPVNESIVNGIKEQWGGGGAVGGGSLLSAHPGLGWLCSHQKGRLWHEVEESGEKDRR